MKRLLVGLGIAGLVSMAPNSALNAQDPITLVIQQGVTKVIVAVDLKIQRLQNKTIWLQNAQKVMENDMSKLKLDEISDWVEKHRELYQDYFDELWQVKSVLMYYHRIREITNKQILLVKEYNRAWSGVRQDPHFTSEEIQYIGKVYAGIIEESLGNLEQIALVINSFATQMTDARRIEIIDAAADALEQNYHDLQAFSEQNILLSLGRAKDAHDVTVIKNLYGIQ